MEGDRPGGGFGGMGSAGGSCGAGLRLQGHDVWERGRHGERVPGTGGEASAFFKAQKGGRVGKGGEHVIGEGVTGDAAAVACSFFWGR